MDKTVTINFYHKFKVVALDYSSNLTRNNFSGLLFVVVKIFINGCGWMWAT